MGARNRCNCLCSLRCVVLFSISCLLMLSQRIHIRKQDEKEELTLERFSSLAVGQGYTVTCRFFFFFTWQGTPVLLKHVWSPRHWKEERKKKQFFVLFYCPLCFVIWSVFNRLKGVFFFSVYLAVCIWSCQASLPERYSPCCSIG